MKVHQLSVFIENKVGRIAEVAETLGAAGVNIRGFSISDTVDYGILRVVVDKPGEGKAALRAAGFTAKESEVICVKLEDDPGALAEVLWVVSGSGVNIEYVYSLVARYVVLNVSDVDHALELLASQPVRLVSHEEIAGTEYAGIDRQEEQGR